MKTISWPGAKRRRVDDLLAWCPAGEIGATCEPFWGTGALTVELLRLGRVTGPVFAAEANGPLRRWWSWLLSDVDGAVGLMGEWRAKYGMAGDEREVYGEMRTRWNSMQAADPDGADTSALLWCLVYASTNNLARFNRKGEYNQTWGRGRVIPDPAAMFAPDTVRVLDDLAGRIEMHTDFQAALDAFFAYVDDGGVGVCYLDPPYVLQAEMYDANRWGAPDVARLMDYLEGLEARHAWWFYTDYLERAGAEHPYRQALEAHFRCQPVSLTGNARPTGSSVSSLEVVVCGSVVEEQRRQRGFDWGES